MHLTNVGLHRNVEKDAPRYDKLHQTRWLLNAIWERYKDPWDLEKHMTIDEMMINYKGTYCPIKQYMPNKQGKWDIKVWCLACSTSKCVWNLEVYCGMENIVRESMDNIDANLTPMHHGEPRLAHNVILRMVKDLSHVGHVVVMDNFFSSIGLFKDLLSRDIYAT